MALSKDWREFLELLNSRGVDYVIVGAESLAFHGRRSPDIDPKQPSGRSPTGSRGSRRTRGGRQLV
jgi:hypothetical protein